MHTITSPGYPNSYPPNIKCRWTLKKLNYRQTIIVRFIEINLTNSTNHKDNNTCTSDRVELEEGTVKFRSFQEYRVEMKYEIKKIFFENKKDNIDEICQAI